MRRFIIYLIIISAFSSTAYSQTGEKEFKVPEIHYYLTSKISRYTVLKFNLDRDNNLFSKDSKPSTISVAEIHEIEAIIKKQVSIYNKSGRERITKPEKYFKQLIAIVDSKREKIVWVNCMCEVIGNSWKKSIPIVNDGGSCYFRVKINLTKKIAYNFNTNGVA